MKKDLQKKVDDRPLVWYLIFASFQCHTVVNRCDVNNCELKRCEVDVEFLFEIEAKDRWYCRAVTV